MIILYLSLRSYILKKIEFFSANQYKLSELDPELSRIILLAKYGDVTTLAYGSPYIDYTTEDFQSYRDAALEAKNYYENEDNKQALDNLGESSAHDMVFLHQFKHRMASHGDEGGHPKGKPEDFARITTYCNGYVIVTTGEEQYLRLLFTNPDMLNQQSISVHPYWIGGIKPPEEASETTAAYGWLDILKIQALKICISC